MPQQGADEVAREAAARSLRRYGYLRTADAPPSASASMRDADSTVTSGSDLFAALSEYQRRHGLVVTGTLDSATDVHLSQSRCTWVDEPNGEPRLRMEASPPLAAHELARSALVLPWFLSPIPVGMPQPMGIANAVATAFSMWESVTPVRFPRQLQGGTARVIVGFAPMDGQGGLLGRTSAGGPMQLDSGEMWSLTDPPATGANADVLTIALHEIGHVLNIGDDPDPNAVMHGFFGAGPALIRRAFNAADFRAISTRFGTT
jgi:hypothetical protein